MPTTTLAMTAKKPLFLAMTSLRLSGELTIEGRDRAIIEKIAEPPATSIDVRIPASLPASSRSRPIKAPRAMARSKLIIICSRVSIV